MDMIPLINFYRLRFSCAWWQALLWDTLINGRFAGILHSSCFLSLHSPRFHQMRHLQS